jgi:hypothetical protein
MGGGGIAQYTFLTSALHGSEVSDISPGRFTPCTLGQKAEWTCRQSEHGGKEKKIPVLGGIRTPVVQLLLACDCIDNCFAFCHLIFHIVIIIT